MGPLILGAPVNLWRGEGMPGYYYSLIYRLRVTISGTMDSALWVETVETYDQAFPGFRENLMGLAQSNVRDAIWVALTIHNEQN